MEKLNYLNVDIVSNKKTSEEGLEKIIAEMESSVSYPDVMEVFLSNISLNNIFFYNKIFLIMIYLFQSFLSSIFFRL